jgi:saccharopine dehydrogenase (NAD+, L-lysine-forming)
VGSGIVKLLARMDDVEQLAVAGRSPERAENLIESLGRRRPSFVRLDLEEEADRSELLNSFDIVVNATYARYNLKIMGWALRAGCHYVDLGGMFHITREQLALDRDFREAKRTAVLCMGACPGMSNIFAAHGARKLDRVDDIRIRVGSKRGADFTGFNMAPETLFAEFTRSPYVYKDGDWRKMEPLSGRERYRLPDPIGEVEGFFCIHSEVLTLPMTFPETKRVTYQVSFPAAVMNMMDVLLGLKLLSSDPFRVSGVNIPPRQYIESYLGATTKTVTGYREEYKALQVEVRGWKAGRKTGWVCETVVGSNRDLDLLSSAYWTSIPHSISVAMLGRGAIEKYGVFPPETAVDADLFLGELRKSGIEVAEKTLRS